MAATRESLCATMKTQHSPKSERRNKERNKGIRSLVVVSSSAKHHNVKDDLNRRRGRVEAKTLIGTGLCVGDVRS